MEAPAINEPLPVGTPASPFALRDPSGELVRLEDLRGRPVVIVFNSLDWSPGCSQQLDLYQQELDEFRARGAKLVAISVDSLYSHGAWAAVRGSAPEPMSIDEFLRRVADRAGTDRAGAEAAPCRPTSVRSTRATSTRSRVDRPARAVRGARRPPRRE